MGLIRRWYALVAFAGVALGVSGTALGAPRDVYVTTYTSPGAVSEFALGAGGTLTGSGSITAVGSDTWYAAATPNAKYLYAGNYGGADLSQYDILASGSLQAMSSPTVPAGTDPTGVAVAPSGRYVYVANYVDNTISIFNVGSTGALTPNSQATEAANLNGPYGIAISPNGKSLYVVNDNDMTGSAGLAQFNIATTGHLSPKSVPTVRTGVEPTWVVLTPNGRNAYVTNYRASKSVPATISEYRVGAGGALAPLGSTTSAGTGDDGLWQAAVSPNGKNLYAPNDTAIYQYNIAKTGELTPKFKPSVTAPAGAEDIWLTANGKSAYSANFVSSTTGSVSEWNVSPTGGLTPKSTPNFSLPGAAAVMIAPDQGPVAAFKDTPAATGKPTVFNASASHDGDGKVVSYAWSFGDGTIARTATLSVAHRYKKAGKYTVTLTVTDDSGCSTSFVFTGVTAYCNGGPRARIKRTITVK